VLEVVWKNGFAELSRIPHHETATPFTPRHNWVQALIFHHFQYLLHERLWNPLLIIFIIIFFFFFLHQNHAVFMTNPFWFLCFHFLKGLAPGNIHFPFFSSEQRFVFLNQCQHSCSFNMKVSLSKRMQSCLCLFIFMRVILKELVYVCDQIKNTYNIQHCYI